MTTTETDLAFPRTISGDPYTEDIKRLKSVYYEKGPKCAERVQRDEEPIIIITRDALMKTINESRGES